MPLTACTVGQPSCPPPPYTPPPLLHTAFTLRLLLQTWFAAHIPFTTHTLAVHLLPIERVAFAFSKHTYDVVLSSTNGKRMRVRGARGRGAWPCAGDTARAALACTALFRGSKHCAARSLRSYSPALKLRCWHLVGTLWRTVRAWRASRQQARINIAQTFAVVTTSTVPATNAITGVRAALLRAPCSCRMRCVAYATYTPFPTTPTPSCLPHAHPSILHTLPHPICTLHTTLHFPAPPPYTPPTVLPCLLPRTPHLHTAPSAAHPHPAHHTTPFLPHIHTPQERRRKDGWRIPTPPATSQPP